MRPGEPIAVKPRQLPKLRLQDALRCYASKSLARAAVFLFGYTASLVLFDLFFKVLGIFAF